MKWTAWLIIAGSMSSSSVICETAAASATVGRPAAVEAKLEAAFHPSATGPRDSRHVDRRGGAAGMVTNNFTLLGHDDLGAVDTHGDVWVHGNFAYVGTWSTPCSGLGVKVVDVSNLRAPRMIGRLAAREGTSAEDVVVRRVETAFFRGDLLATGIQRCGFPDAALDQQTFGVEFWDVNDPYHPRKLSELGLAHGNGGVHELDLFQRGDHVYALLATPFTEWFDPQPGGDFRIVDVTDPAHPIQVGEWGAGAAGLSPGPLFGIGSFGAVLDHSARASADGRRAYVSYWDLGVLTLDISDPTRPVLLTRTRYAPDDDGEAHSLSVYEAKHHRTLLLQNDEDFDPTSPTHILFGRHGRGIGQSSPSAPAVWDQPDHMLSASVIEAANDGCAAADYPAETVGKIAVVRTPFPFFDGSGAPPLCDQVTQERAAAAAGASAVVHDFVAAATSPQSFDFADPPISIPVLFTDHATARGMIAAGRATLRGRKPSWGFLRVFDAETGVQVAKFDDVPNVHALLPPPGFWSIHNNEVVNDRAYASWYSNGVVALDLKPLDRRNPRDPELVGQFVPPAEPPRVPNFPEAALVWGVAVRSKEVEDMSRGRGRGEPGRDGGDEDEAGKDRNRRESGRVRHPIVFASDMTSGLWIIEPNAGHPVATIGDREGAEAIGDDEAGATPFPTGQPVKAFGLGRVTPNPMFGVADIEFALPRASRVRLSVLDAQGRLVARLVEGVYPVGRHRAVWSDGSERGHVPAGIYFVQLETPEGNFAKRIVRMR